MWFSLISGSPAALFPLSTLFDIGIIIKRRASVKKPPALIRPINLQKVAIKKHELLLFCYWNLLGEEKKKRREVFQFHSLQNTQVFIALYFSLSTSLREAGLMTSMYAALIHNAIQPSDMLRAIRQHRRIALLLASSQLKARPGSQSAIWQFCPPFSAALSKLNTRPL